MSRKMKHGEKLAYKYKFLREKIIESYRRGCKILNSFKNRLYFQKTFYMPRSSRKKLCFACIRHPCKDENSTILCTFHQWHMMILQKIWSFRFLAFLRMKPHLYYLGNIHLCTKNRTDKLSRHLQQRIVRSKNRSFRIARQVCPA